VGEPGGNLGGTRGRRTSSDHQYVTLQDVAARAGVSAKSVSRVVNRQGEISEATRTRIQAVIDELGYRPNSVARSLLRQRTNTLAAVAWGIEYFGPSRTITGIEQQAEELGYSVFLILVREPEKHEHKEILDALVSRRVDGIVWAVPEVGENRSWLNAGWLRQLPPIAFLSMSALPGVRVVAVNNRGGARTATDHLIQRGRRKIGIITGPMAWWEARERYEGWKGAIESRGLSVWDHLIAESYWSSAGGERAMRELLQRAPDIDGVFASSDQIALGALRAIAESGKRVPEDIAIVGFDNMPESEYFRPPLTTMQQGLADAGRAAVRAVHHMIEARGEAPRTPSELVMTIEPELIIRSSAI
jgi:LacI family transcriptional regulator